MFNFKILKITKGKFKSLIIKFLNLYFCLKYESEVCNIIKQCNNLKLNTSTIYDLWVNFFCIKKIINNKIEGDIVECGIWKGISIVFFNKILDLNKIKEKKIIGYDTFEGFPKPSQKDITKDGSSMRSRFETNKINVDSSNWNYCSLADVRMNIENNTISSKNIVLIKGKVENTLKDENNIPKKISILKLDTCLYESTKKELKILFPRIQKGGILIIDNYINFKGVQDAVKEYFEKSNFELKYDRLSGQIIVNI
jgi:O-methyltransferase